MTTALARRSAVTAAGLRKSFGDKVVLDGIDLDIAEGTVFALLGPNGAGKTTTVQILSTLLPADAGDVRVAGYDLRREPDAVRRVDRRDRPVLGRRRPAHRRGEPASSWPTCATSAAARAGGWPPSCSSGSTSSRRPGSRPSTLLRRDAAPARPGDDPGRRPAGHLPGRADHRPRPAQPPQHVADHPRPRGRRGHDLPHDAVPRRGRPAGRPDRRARPRRDRRRRHAGRAQAAHPRRPRSGCSSPTRTRSTRPRASSAASTATTTPDAPGAERRRRPQPAGAARPARRRARSRSTSSPSTPRTSTTCSSALTGPPDARKEPADEQPRLRSHRLRNDAATQPAARAALPLDDDARRSRCPSCSCCCSSTSSAARSAPASAASPDAAADYINYVAPGILVMTVTAGGGLRAPRSRSRWT